MSNVVSIERARLARAVASGEPELVLDAVERALDVPELHEAAQEALYVVFWQAAEDEELGERAGRLDLFFAAR